MGSNPKFGKIGGPKRYPRNERYVSHMHIAYHIGRAPVAQESGSLGVGEQSSIMITTLNSGIPCVGAKNLTDHSLLGNQFTSMGDVVHERKKERTPVQ
jgi:hypothetical protein